jgi:hypothetical protein
MVTGMTTGKDIGRNPSYTADITERDIGVIIVKVIFGYPDIGDNVPQLQSIEGGCLKSNFLTGRYFSIDF